MSSAAKASQPLPPSMISPIKVLFRFFTEKARVQFMLYENKDLRIEGVISGFDEFMNIVLQDAEELNVKKQTRKILGSILLKGDNISAVFPAPNAMSQ
ncbi:hypothetical protein P9112_013117 [Eukaryota sp. TZLM1-RC]